MSESAATATATATARFLCHHAYGTTLATPQVAVVAVVVVVATNLDTAVDSVKHFEALNTLKQALKVHVLKIA